MKHRVTFPSLTLICVFIIASCSNPTPSEHEYRYQNALDSLKLYQYTSYLQKEIAGNEKTRDLLELSYDDFKEKYQWNDAEMDEFSDMIQGHVRIAKTLDALNDVSPNE